MVPAVVLPMHNDGVGVLATLTELTDLNRHEILASVAKHVAASAALLTFLLRARPSRGFLRPGVSAV